MEITVAIVVIVFLALLLMPNVTDRDTLKGQQTQALSNMKQLHLATQQMALDASNTGDTNIGWPGDTGGSFQRWATNLVGGNYLSTNDLYKLLSAGNHITRPRALPGGNTNAVLVYAITTNSPCDAVFLSTENFTNTPTGGLPPLKGAPPFNRQGFVVFHQAGDGLILQNRQTGPAYTNIIGSYVPLCR